MYFIHKIYKITESIGRHRLFLYIFFKHEKYGPLKPVYFSSVLKDLCFMKNLFCEPIPCICVSMYMAQNIKKLALAFCHTEFTVFSRQG